MTITVGNNGVYGGRTDTDRDEAAIFKLQSDPALQADLNNPLKSVTTLPGES